MVQIDVPVAFGIGCLFADAASKQLQFGRPEFYYRTFWIHNIFQICFFSWIPMYFLLNYFGWGTTHMWWHQDAVTAYPYFVPIFLVIFFAAAHAGFLLGHRLVSRGWLWANRLIYLGIAAYTLVWVFGQTNRTFRLGSYTQFKNGTAPLFYQDRTFLGVFVFSMIVWGTGLIVFSCKLRQEGKHLDYQESVRTT
jgi:hypothetical protein